MEETHGENRETLRGPHVGANFICEERRGSERNCERGGEGRTDDHQALLSRRD